MTDEEPTATGAVTPTGPRQRAALLTLKAQVERLTAAHDQVGRSIEALARNQRTLSGALNGLLSAITGLLKAQEQDVATAGTGWVGSDFTERFAAQQTAAHPRRDALLEAFTQDPGHPCRDCGRYFDEHPVEPTDAESAVGQASCEAWR